jgi:hypothetical protein
LTTTVTAARLTLPQVRASAPVLASKQKLAISTAPNGDAELSSYLFFGEPARRSRARKKLFPRVRLWSHWGAAVPLVGDLKVGVGHGDQTEQRSLSVFLGVSGRSATTHRFGWLTSC